MCHDSVVAWSRPQVVAHRGASEAEPEHTLAAYLEAIEAGADALECDVRMTADGHLVCVHDRRVNRTSDGNGLVSTLELAQLEGLDWGSWKQLAASRGGAETSIPQVVERSDRAHLLTLRRLLGVVRDAGRPIQLAVETKHPTRYGGLVERKLVEVLREFGWAGPTRDGPSPVRMMSFSSLALRRMHALAPRVPLVYLIEYRIPIPMLERSAPVGAAIGPGVDLLREHPRYIERLRGRGHDLHVWTADRPEDGARCVRAGASVIITNRPAEVRRLLNDWPPAGEFLEADGPHSTEFPTHPTEFPTHPTEFPTHPTHPTEPRSSPTEPRSSPTESRSGPETEPPRSVMASRPPGVPWPGIPALSRRLSTRRGRATRRRRSPSSRPRARRAGKPGTSRQRRW